jgi:hypothetical protein
MINHPDAINNLPSNIIRKEILHMDTRIYSFFHYIVFGTLLLESVGHPKRAAFKRQKNFYWFVSDRHTKNEHTIHRAVKVETKANLVFSKLLSSDIKI